MGTVVRSCGERNTAVPSVGMTTKTAAPERRNRDTSRATAGRQRAAAARRARRHADELEQVPIVWWDPETIAIVRALADAVDGCE